MELATDVELRPGSVHLLGPVQVPGIGSRNVRIFLPPGFRPGMRAPALYMFDGQNLFDDGPAFGEGWRLHEVLAGLPLGDRTPVVVGIDHGGEHRLDELSPFSSDRSAGHADQLLGWMGSTLMPAISHQLRLLSGRDQTFIGGSSMGGLCALYALFRHPECFSGALCMSPAFWFVEKRLFEHLDERRVPPNARVYLDVGQREGPRMVRPTERMARYLAERGLSSDRLRLEIDARGGHNENDWRRRLPAALRFLLAPRETRPSTS